MAPPGCPARAAVVMSPAPAAAAIATLPAATNSLRLMVLMRAVYRAADGHGSQRQAGAIKE